uniref:Retrotransposon protein, putative, Ty1-copia subclass n=1 Tax=Tanacetum cinerariifolium TaxID=118510 RepID=A0A6L2JUB5_TANCI|nr:hypothetical protein [Tanacetum cinerariifolium]
MSSGNAPSMSSGNDAHMSSGNAPSMSLGNAPSMSLGNAPNDVKHKVKSYANMFLLLLFNSSANFWQWHLFSSGSGKQTNNKASENQEDTRGKGGKIQKKKRNTTEEDGSSSQVNGQNEKNVAESLVRTLLYVSGKTKDGVNARLDLAELGVKPELFPMQEEYKKTLPPAAKKSDCKLDKMQAALVVTLCLFKKFFPPPFFDIMVIKGHVQNRNRPEGCIVEETITKETTEFLANIINPWKLLVSHLINMKLRKMRKESHYRPGNQNSGVSVEAIALHISKEVATIRQAFYYGVLQEIWVLDYRFRQIPLFKCDWVNHRAGGVKRDTTLGYTLVDLNNLSHKVDSFILASQARQVFYVKDQIDKKVSIVFKIPPKNYKDMYDEVDEEFSIVIHQHNDNILQRVDQHDLELIVILDSSDDNNGPSIPRVCVYGPSVQGLLDKYGYDNIRDYISDFYFPSTDKEDTIVHIGQDPIHECHSPNSKESSITSIPKEGPSIASLSKEPIPKELLAWYGYDTVKDYLPVAEKPIPKVIFKSLNPIKRCVLGLANVETWDNIIKIYRMRTPGRCADKSKGKERFDVEANVLAEWNAIYDAYNVVACLILGSTTLELHRQFKNSSPYDMIKELKSVFEKQDGVESNSIYEIDMHDLVPNVNSIYNVSTKRAKHKLDSTYLWHYLLSYISNNRIEKLQQEGLLRSTDDESFDQCVSCLLGMIIRKSFPHRPKRATDLLGIIHTHVCGPLRHVSRQGASYFITFTDDYSRYGYQLTPPYTPQHNGVSKRRNSTLLDMVRSMMNLTALPLSFWDYALESATRILTMVPFKKVDKTPYELWYGKVLKLSYLKVWGCEALVKRDTLDKLQQRSVKYAEFFEKNLITQEVSGRAVDLKEIQDEDTPPSKITSEIPMVVEGFEPPQEEAIPIRRSERTHRAPNHLCLNVEVEEHSLGDLNEANSYKVVMSKWIFKKKTNMDGIVHTYKARLIAKGYTQLYRVDYKETFSPVADIRAIRILISVTAFYDYEIWKMDVKTTFLNGYLDKDIYMVQPEGFVDPNHLKKASRSNVTFLILYIDDIIIMGNHIPSLQGLKDYLGKCFAMKDLREATFILGIKIYRDRSKRLIELGQNSYMDKILNRYKMDNSKRGCIPMQEKLDLNKTQGALTPKEVKRMQNVPYDLVVGSIMYAVRCTRPDVAFAQNITSRFQQNLGELYWTAVKNILKYLRNTEDMFLVYDGNLEAKLRVDCYCDARFEIDRDDTKSQTGYVFILNGGAMD